MLHFDINARYNCFSHFWTLVRNVLRTCYCYDIKVIFAPCNCSKLAKVTIHAEFIKTQLCLKRNILRHLHCKVVNSPAYYKIERGKHEARANISLFIVCNKKTFVNPLANTKSRNLVLKNFVLITIIVFSLS